jgi:hypothetical protein
MTRAVRLSIVGLLLAGLGVLPLASAAPTTKQRMAFDVTLPLDSDSGRFELSPMTPGAIAHDSGATHFTSGPTPIFMGRLVHGQLIDRFQAVEKLVGANGDLTVRITVDFASAGNGYQNGRSTWRIVEGTGAYAGLRGGGRGALVRPPTPPGQYGFARHEGFVSEP